jgi:4,5-DOPA dioxygenase extradiol
MAILPFAGITMKLNEFQAVAGLFKTTGPMPVLFIGHGSPMNALEENEFTHEWKALGSEIPVPAAILCISAHWETRGTWVTAMDKPQTIHDFGGFPKALFDVQYPAPGSPELASGVRDLLTGQETGLDTSWGLDHGTWSILRQMYPLADIPVVQLSLDYNRDAAWHYDLASRLAELRQKGVLIIGSGNMVHNLRMLDWNHPDKGYDWADEANAKFKQLILSHQHDQLIRYPDMGKAVDLSIPSPEHYLPLLYTLAMQSDTDSVTFFNDKTVMGSLSMTSVKIG